MPATLTIQNSPLWGLQAWEYEAMSAAGINIVDEILETTAYPYVVFLGAADRPQEIGKGASGLHVVTNQYRITSRYRGFKEVKQLVASLFAALASLEPTAPGFAIDSYEAGVSNIFRGEDERGVEARFGTVQVTYRLWES